MTDPTSAGVTEIAQLVLVRQLAAEADRYVDQRTPFSAGVAISLMQDACELTLKAIVKERGIHVREPSQFEDVLKALGDVKEGQTHPALPMRTKLFELNRARVGFKHHGTVPSVETGEKLTRYGNSFLTQAVPAYFGIEFDSLSLADLIRAEKVRQHVKSAEEALREGDGATALIDAARAVNATAGALKKLLPKADPNLQRLGDAFTDRHEAEAIRNGFDYLVRYLNGAHEALLMVQAGVSVARMNHFNSFAPRIVTTMNGQEHVRWVRSVPPLEQVEACVAFARDFGLAAQRQEAWVPSPSGPMA